jgi:hypothetical protein
MNENIPTNLAKLYGRYQYFLATEVLREDWNNKVIVDNTSRKTTQFITKIKELRLSKTHTDLDKFLELFELSTVHLSAYLIHISWYLEGSSVISPEQIKEDEVAFMYDNARFTKLAYDIGFENNTHSEDDHFMFGPWTLGASLDESYENDDSIKFYGLNVPIRKVLNVLEGKPLKEFKRAGAKAEYRDEVFYEAIPVNNVGYSNWDTVLSTHEGNIYKIGLTLPVTQDNYGMTLSLVSNDLNRRFGNSELNKHDKNEFIYEDSTIRARLATREIPNAPGMYIFRLVARLS